MKIGIKPLQLKARVASVVMLLVATGCSSPVIQDANAQLVTSASVSALVLKADQVKYEVVAPFVSMGAAWGDRSKGAHGTFGRFPGGAASPAHTHSGAYHGVVISGLMTNPFNEETNPPQMGPGSHWYVPAGKPHITACVSAEPCTFYFHAEGNFDFAPTGK